MDSIHGAFAVSADQLVGGNVVNPLFPGFPELLIQFLLGPVAVGNHLVKEFVVPHVRIEGVFHEYDRNVRMGVPKYAEESLSVALDHLFMAVWYFVKHKDCGILDLGHQTGDQCLRTLGKCFAEFGEENDFEFYRYGGEEFCALTTKDTYDELREHAERLRRKVENLAMPFEQSERGVVTISIGFAPHYYTQNYEVTIKQADDALYNAKRTGRNCIFGSK